MGSLLFRPDFTMVNPEFLQLFFSSPDTKAYLESNAQGSTMLNLNQKVVGSIPIEIPPLDLQEKVIKQKNNLLNLVHSLENQVRIVNTLIPTLHHTLFSRAFRGELVEQDPADEPAGVLLAKIKIEKVQLVKEAKNYIKQGQKKMINTDMDESTHLIETLTNKFDKQRFTFEQLQEQFSNMDYEILKREIFNSLEGGKSEYLKIEFDPKSGQIKFYF
ncbi:MAG: restriction endonuclease subunit S [Lewinellaceae bacterium]|nr:restriction endonuclease subunit S [Lewinellaceae bacterium]